MRYLPAAWPCCILYRGGCGGGVAERNFFSYFLLFIFFSIFNLVFFFHRTFPGQLRLTSESPSRLRPETAAADGPHQGGLCRVQQRRACSMAANCKHGRPIEEHVLVIRAVEQAACLLEVELPRATPGLLCKDQGLLEGPSNQVDLKSTTVGLARLSPDPATPAGRGWLTPSCWWESWRRSASDSMPSTSP